MKPELARLSLNQMTTRQLDTREAIEGCVRFGIPSIGLWREPVAATGLQETARLVREAGLHVSSLCRGGWFAAESEAGRQARIDDNKRAIEEAAELGADSLVLVCGPAATKDIVAARAWVAEAIERILPYAIELGVKLAIEPLHPMFAADRSVIVSLGEANRLARTFASPNVGVIVDIYHLWWDEQIYAEIEAARGQILGFHVNDWIVPPPDFLNGRGMMGDGVIEIRRLREAVDAAGYHGPIEVEIFNQKLWDLPGDELLSLMCNRFVEHV
jgi:sugar phosphate isomerase/epimerase